MSRGSEIEEEDSPEADFAEAFQDAMSFLSSLDGGVTEQQESEQGFFESEDFADWTKRLRRGSGEPLVTILPCAPAKC